MQIMQWIRWIVSEFELDGSLVVVGEYVGAVCMIVHACVIDCNIDGPPTV